MVTNWAKNSGRSAAMGICSPANVALNSEHCQLHLRVWYTFDGFGSWPRIQLRIKSPAIVDVKDNVLFRIRVKPFPDHVQSVAAARKNLKE